VEDQYRAEHLSTMGRISVLKNNSHEGPYPSNMILAGASLYSQWKWKLQFMLGHD